MMDVCCSQEDRTGEGGGGVDNKKIIIKKEGISSLGVQGGKRKVRE